MNWLLLAFSAGREVRFAFGEGDARRGLQWAQAAVAIYDALSADVREPHSFDVSSMFTRVVAIGACGAKPGDNVLDTAVIVNWVRQVLVGAPNDAVLESKNFFAALAAGKRPSIETARRLRRIKTRLAVLEALEPRIAADGEMRGWLIVRDQLI